MHFLLGENYYKPANNSGRPWLNIRLADGAVIPDIAVHPNLPNPRYALIEVGKNSKIGGSILVWGDCPIIRIGADVSMPNAELFCGDTAKIEIGDRLQCNGPVKINARHDGSVTVGNDNLWSAFINIATDDMHAIRDLKTHGRVNKRGGHISVGHKVWLGYDCLIRGGAKIGDGGMVGERARIAKSVPNNSIVVGSGRVVRSGIYWSHDDLP